MQFSAVLITLFASMAIAAPSQTPARSVAEALLERAVNNGRPVATGACCIANTSKKGDTCTDATGATGTCAVADTAGCDARLTCVA